MTEHSKPRPDDTLVLEGRLMELDNGQHGYLLRDDVGHEFALLDSHGDRSQVSSDKANLREGSTIRRDLTSRW